MEQGQACKQSIAEVKRQRAAEVKRQLEAALARAQQLAAVKVGNFAVFFNVLIESCRIRIKNFSLNCKRS